jgi:predicted nuclease of predicted toxin-antitoxin system
MRFLVDESTGVAVANWLREQGHEVFSVYEEARGMDDDSIIQKAFTESWILITNDKDFGDKVYRERYPHKGVILLRLQNERAINKVKTLQQLLNSRYREQLADNFVVLTDTQIRFAGKPKSSSTAE